MRFLKHFIDFKISNRRVLVNKALDRRVNLLILSKRIVVPYKTRCFRVVESWSIRTFKYKANRNARSERDETNLFNIFVNYTY